MIRIEIKSNDLSQLSDNLIGNKSPLVGTTIQLSDDSTLTYLSGLGEHFGFNDLITFVLETTSSISIGLVGSILYDKLKGTDTISLLINGKAVKVTKEAIIEALEEHFKKSDKDVK